MAWGHSPTLWKVWAKSLLDKGPPASEVELNFDNSLTEFIGEESRTVSFSDAGRNDPGKHGGQAAVLKGLDFSLRPGEWMLTLERSSNHAD